MKTLVIDASIAVKWMMIEEVGTRAASKGQADCPDLLVAECADIFWKKVRRKELLREEALLAARLLQGADIELLPMRSLFERATRMSIEIDHPAYDCLYLALALAAATDCQFVTAEEHFLRKAREKQRMLRGRIVSLNEMAGFAAVHAARRPRRHRVGGARQSRVFQQAFTGRFRRHTLGSAAGGYEFNPCSHELAPWSHGDRRGHHSLRGVASASRHGSTRKASISVLGWVLATGAIASSRSI